MNEKPIRKYTQVFKDAESISTWEWDKDIFPNGPISVTIEYLNEEVQENGLTINNEDLPKTKRRYINEATGKSVAYFRAKQLGLID